MAIKVGGTTVIDDSRNLCSTGYANVTTVNATTICATTLYGSGTNITGISASPPAQCFTACGTVTIGSPVSCFPSSSTGIVATLGDPVAICTTPYTGTGTQYFMGICCNPNCNCGLNNFVGQHCSGLTLRLGFVPSMSWVVNFQTGSNTIHQVGYTPGAIGFNSFVNALCAACCNTGGTFCCAATLNSGGWLFTTHCLNTTTCNICQKDTGYIAWCPCTSPCCCTSYPSYCRQRTQAIPFTNGAPLCGSCDCSCYNSDPYATCFYKSVRDSQADTYPYVSSGGSVNGCIWCYAIPSSGWVGTQHMAALSCSGNKAYLMFYTQTPGIDLGTGCSFCQSPFICNGACYRTVNMMTFCKCTDGINFCACPSVWTCSPLTSNTDRIGYLTRCENYMFDMIITCGQLGSNECGYNCYALYVRPVDDSFCTNYTSALVAGTCYTQIYKSANCAGCCTKGYTHCALPRFFPLAENCDGWIIGYSPANNFCITATNTSCGVGCMCSSVARFFAIKPTGLGTAIITPCICLSDIPVSCTNPLILVDTTLCNPFCTSLCTNRMVFTNTYNLDTCNASAASTFICYNQADFGRRDTLAPSIQLFDMTQVGNNVIRAHFVTSYSAPSNYCCSLQICVCGTSTASAVHGETKVDFCVNNATCTLAILSCSNDFRCMQYSTGCCLRALFGPTQQCFCALNVICTSSNNFLFQGATWGANCNGEVVNTGALNSLIKWYEDYRMNNCSEANLGISTGHTPNTSASTPPTPYDYWKWHGIQHDCFNFADKFIATTTICSPASGFCTASAYPCQCACGFGCLPLCFNSFSTCGNCLAARVIVSALGCTACITTDCYLRSRCHRILTDCPAAFASTSSGSCIICTSSPGVNACAFGLSYQCLYAGGSYWGACSWFGLNVADSSSSRALRIATVNQNNTCGFLGFAIASGTAGSCIPVATMGHGVACCLSITPGCYKVMCNSAASCPNCFESLLSSCYGLINPCICTGYPWSRQSSSCCPRDETMFCVYATTDRGCVGFFSR